MTLTTFKTCVYVYVLFFSVWVYKIVFVSFRLFCALILFLHCHLGHCYIVWICNFNVSLCFKPFVFLPEKKKPDTYIHSIGFSEFVVANQTLIVFHEVFFSVFVYFYHFVNCDALDSNLLGKTSEREWATKKKILTQLCHLLKHHK